MPQLFKAKTINQFRIHAYLQKEGMTSEAVQAVTFPSADSVQITDGVGDMMTVSRVGLGVYRFEYVIGGNVSAELRHDYAEILKEETT